MVHCVRYNQAWPKFSYRETEKGDAWRRLRASYKIRATKGALSCSFDSHRRLSFALISSGVYRARYNDLGEKAPGANFVPLRGTRATSANQFSYGSYSDRKQSCAYLGGGIPPQVRRFLIIFTRYRDFATTSLITLRKRKTFRSHSNSQ